MTLVSVSSSGRVQDALSGRPKVAIVTGAASGIGLEAVRRPVACGYRVGADSRNITSANSLGGTRDLKLADGDIGIRAGAQRVVGTAPPSFGRHVQMGKDARLFIPE